MKKRSKKLSPPLSRIFLASRRQGQKVLWFGQSNFETQRLSGLDKKANGLVGQHFPKRTSFATPAAVLRVQNKPSARPRKVLGFFALVAAGKAYPYAFQS